MRLPPSSDGVAHRGVQALRRQCRPRAARRASAASTRARQAPRHAVEAGVRHPADGMRGEGLGAVRIVRIAEQAHAQFGLFQRGLAAAVQADAAFVRGERFLQAHLAVFHLLDELLELVERGLEIGDRGWPLRSAGLRRHGGEVCGCVPGEGGQSAVSRARRPAQARVVGAQPGIEARRIRPRRPRPATRLRAWTAAAAVRAATAARRDPAARA